MDSSLTPGSVLFGEYEIVQKVGGGGMGNVYSARHRSMDELRAIKVVPRDGDAKKEEFLVREAKSLMRVNHDGVVRCHELLRDDQRLYLVMEFVEGPSLQRILLQGPLPDDEVRALRRRILEALGAIHAQGVAHRDISPANIILPDGAPEKAKLVDFGLSGNEASDGKKGFRGNPVYASPEQYGLFGGRVEAASDFYSLGLVLAEAAAGEPLAMGDTQNERSAFRKSAPPLPEYLPAELRAEILPLLEPDPRKRPASAQAALSSRAAPEVVRKKAAASEAPPLMPVVFLASAIGVGMGLGFTLWAWKHTRLMGSSAAAVVAVSPPVKPMPAPVVSGNPPQPAPPAPPPPYQPVPAPSGGQPGTITRAQVMAMADQLVGHEWRPAAANLQAGCKLRKPYKSDWSVNVSVKGLPYCWGGMDGIDDYQRKLRLGLAAGSHSWHGVASCTTGMDCSGFVLYVWGYRGGHPHTTRTLKAIAPDMRTDVKTGLKPGDALNWPGKHVVLFGGYQPDGRPLIYEANGSFARVVRREDLTWAKLKKYRPIRYKYIQD